MTSFDPTQLTLSVVIRGARSDPPLVRLYREGMDGATQAWLDDLLATPAAAPLRARARARHREFAGLLELLEELADPATGLRHEEIDLVAVLKRAHRNGTDSTALGRALGGLLVLAALEGLARRYRPGFEYPYISVRLTGEVCLPIARELGAAGAHDAAATVATLLRQYITCDPRQRMTIAGIETIAACRRIEAARDRHLHACCQRTAWLLHRRMDEAVLSLCVAALFFALGDVLRARAVVRSNYRPSLGVLVDLVEVGVELVTVDPLLQAVWLVTLGEVGDGVPDDVRFRLRQIAPEINSRYKGADAAAKELLGMSFSAAYAQGVLAYLSGMWDEHTTQQAWWKVLKEALELPLEAPHYRSGLVRQLELFSLATEPGTVLPNSELVSSFAGAGPVPRSDLREVATLSLSTDQWTAQRGQLGRSLAYDSAFLIEPWRREEPASLSAAMLEAHRHASLKYWLTVIPPMTTPPKGRLQRRAIEQDRAIAREYRALAFLGTLEEAPVYLRAYGEPGSQRILHVDGDERLRTLMQVDARRRDWYEDTAQCWPEYAHARMEGPATVDEIAEMLGIG